MSLELVKVAIRKLWSAIAPKDRWPTAIVLGMTIAFLVFVVGMTGLGYWRTGVLLEREGVPTTAIVTATAGRSQIWFKWRVGSQIFESSDGEGHRVHHVGDTIPIRYLPSTPSVAHFDWVRLQWRGKMLFFVGLPFGILPLAFVWLRIRRRAP